MNACKIVEVINGREKGIIDPRYPLADEDIEALISSEVDDITVRRPPVAWGHGESLKIVAAETYLRRNGWVKWDIDPYVWLRPGHKEIRGYTV